MFQKTNINQMNLVTIGNQQTQSLGMLNTAQGIVDVYKGRGQSFISKIVLFFTLPLLLIGFYLFIIYLNKKAVQGLADLAKKPIETEEDFESLKSTYAILNPTTKKRVTDIDLSILPFYIRFFLKPIISLSKTVDAQVKIIEKKIHNYALTRLERKNHIIQLGSVKDYNKLIDEIENPTQPSASLEKAALKYKELLG